MGNCAEGARSLFSLDELRRLSDGRPGRAARYHASERIQDWYTLSNDPREHHFGAPSTAVMSLATRRGKRYAVKTVMKRRCRVAAEMLKNEVQVYVRLDHPHVARLQDVFDLRDHVCMVMELLEGGELFDRAVLGAFSEEDAADACYQMLTAVGYLHKHDPPILHGDLKPENFMYTKADSNVLKLIDFGQARSGPAAGVPPGTLGYQAPEADRRLTRGASARRYTDKSDVFSLGVTAYFLLTGQQPFDPHQGARQQLLQQAYDEPAFLSLSTEAQSFLRALMEYSADMRPTAKEALELPWIKDREQPKMKAARLAPAALAGAPGGPGHHVRHLRGARPHARARRRCRLVRCLYRPPAGGPRARRRRATGSRPGGAGGKQGRAPPGPLLPGGHGVREGAERGEGAGGGGREAGALQELFARGLADEAPDGAPVRG